MDSDPTSFPYHATPGWSEQDGDVVVPDSAVDLRTEQWTEDHIGGIGTGPTDSGSIDKAESIDDLKLDRMTRLKVLFETEGFYPTSNEEFNRMMTFSAQERMPLGVLMHFNEVLSHQERSSSKDARAALRSITSSFADYAMAARRDLLSLSGLIEDPHLNDFNQRANFINTPKLRDLSQDPQVRRALMIMTRTGEIKAFAASGEFDPLLKKNLLDLSPAKRDRMDIYLKPLRIGEVRNLLSSAKEQEGARFDYWVARLQDATQHAHSRDVGVGALTALGFMGRNK